MNRCHAFLAMALLAAVDTCARTTSASEPIGVRPRETETLTVVPRVVTAAGVTPDPAWLNRGALRDSGTYDAPLPLSAHQLNQRQLELLRGLDNLRRLDPATEPALQRAIGPERILPPPREVKK